MIIHGQFYDGIVGKPDLDDALEHYGVLGMKWGVRKNPEKAYSKARAKSEKLSKKYSKAYDKYLKKAKKNKLPIKLSSSRAVVRARAKADLIDAKKKKWEEKVEKVFSDEYRRIMKSSDNQDQKYKKANNLEKIKEKYFSPSKEELKKREDYVKYLKSSIDENKKKVPKEVSKYIDNNKGYDLEAKKDEYIRYLKNPDKWLKRKNR